MEQMARNDTFHNGLLKFALDSGLFRSLMLHGAWYNLSHLFNLFPPVWCLFPQPTLFNFNLCFSDWNYVFLMSM